MAGEFTAEEIDHMVKLIRWWMRLPVWRRIWLYWKHGVLCPWR